MTQAAPSAIPATILTGFLGAGKTTLLNHLLSTSRELRIGVLVNDFGAINIDSELILGVTDDVISLANGCICCSMRGDLMKAVLRVLEHANPPDYLLIEASGVSNPGAIAEMFLELERSRAVRLDGVVCVVDSEQFPFDDLKRQPLARDQVIASDIVVLNKTDLATPQRLEAIEAAIRARLPAVRIFRAERGQVPSDLLLGQNAWTGERARPHVHASDPETELQKAGLRSLAYHSDAPMVLPRLLETAASLPAGVFRMKGFAPRAGAANERYLLNVVSRRVHLERAGDAKEGEGTTLVAIAQASSIDEAELKTRLDECRGDP